MMSGLLGKLSPTHLGNRRGGVLVFVAVGMLTTLVMAGLAIDVGRGYVLKSHLSRAVDAAALSAARSLREGESEAQQRALSVAAANGVVPGGQGNATISLQFGTNEFDEETVSVTASQETPTLLMRLVGETEMQVQSRAVAAVPPVDLVLVLDRSGSLGQAGVWGDLQDAAKQFIQHFDDTIDQMGLVSFNLMAANDFELGQPFTANAISVVNGLTSIGWTNTGEGLRLAHGQITAGANLRDRSAKVVVFFTDGRPTAFRGTIFGVDGVMATSSTTRIGGWYRDPPSLPMTYNPPYTGCVNAYSCDGYRAGDVWDTSKQDGLYWARQIRQDGVLVYTIGLGDPWTSTPSLLPDPDYLRLLSNEDGIDNLSHPKGKMYFAPSGNELRAVFNLVAQDLLARLAH
jgi:Flp pilus assembly protein TadG